MKKNFNYLFISLGLFILTFIFIILGIFDNNQKKDQYIYLNDLIVNKDNQTNTYTYLTITNPPYSIAKYSNDTNGAFYIVSDGYYFYIAYLKNSLANKINEASENNPINIYGISKTTPTDIKEIAIEAYNNESTSEEEITITEFNNYFGNIYIDDTTTYMISYFYFMAIIPFITFIIFSIIFLKSKKPKRKSQK